MAKDPHQVSSFVNQVLVMQEKEDKIPTDADKYRVNMLAESFLNFYGDATEAAEAYMGFHFDVFLPFFEDLNSENDASKLTDYFETAPMFEFKFKMRDTNSKCLYLDLFVLNSDYYGHPTALKMFFTYVLHVLASCTRPEDRLIIIIDCSEFNLMDIGMEVGYFVRNAINLLFEYIPIDVERIYIYNAPFILSMIFKGLQRVSFYRDSLYDMIEYLNTEEEFLSLFHMRSSLPKFLGGDSPDKMIHETTKDVQATYNAIMNGITEERSAPRKSSDVPARREKNNNQKVTPRPISKVPETVYARSGNRKMNYDGFVKMVCDLGVEGLTAEFKKLPVADVSELENSVNSSAAKYRKDVNCVEHSRVTLGDDPLFFYPANYVDGFNRSKEFIMCEAPMDNVPGKDNNIPEFLRMVWETKSPLIVCASPFFEGNSEKVAQYFPMEVGQRLEFYPYELELVRIESQEKSFSKILNFKNLESNEHHRLTLYDMPILAYPSNSNHLDAIANFMGVISAKSESPVIVHDSSGTRMGCVLIAVQIMKKLIQSNVEFDPFRLMEHIRYQRNMAFRIADEYVHTFHKCLNVDKDRYKRLLEPGTYERFKDTFPNGLWVEKN